MSDRPLNVLWLIDHVCYDGSLHGGGRLYMNVVPRFDARRVRVHPYFLRASPEVLDVFTKAGHPAKALGVGKYDPTAVTQLWAICRKYKIDVMHLFCYASSTFGRLIGFANRTPTVVHDFDTQIYFPYPVYLKILDRLLAKRTGHAFAASSICKEYMHEVRQIPSELIDVLYHAIPSSHLEGNSQLDRESARTKLGLGDEFVFCAVTKLGPERGNETLLAAFAKVRAHLPRARLFLVYKPTLYHRMPKEYEGIAWARDPKEMRARVDRLIEELAIGDSVTTAEALEHPEPFYAAADVLIAPFEDPRFSSVNLVEGMAYGRPHVVTSIGESFELLERYGGGLAVPPKDAEAMAESMLRIAGDSALRAALGEKARRGAEDLTVDAIAERLTGVYRSLHAKRFVSVEGVGTPA